MAKPSALSTTAPEKPHVDRTEATGHRASRNGAPIDHIVIHYTASRNIEGSIAHFKHGIPAVSAHYIVGRDGTLVQMVPDAACAWHAGRADMNARSIGIEHVAGDGDSIAPAQTRTSIALIGWLMHAYGIPLANVIPHVCVKDTSCCGDLFREFGGGSGLSCARQKAALHCWLAANGIAGDMSVAPAPSPDSRPPRQLAPDCGRMAMARAILDFEARRDAHGRIAVYALPPGDGGGRYEVAGINERYHKATCDALVALIRAGCQAEAEARAAAFIADDTDAAAGWTNNPGVEFYLRDCLFNRGPGGAAWMLQKAAGVAADGIVGPVTLAAVRAAEADARGLLDRLRAAREAYERLRRDEHSPFWAGLVHRWDKARTTALALMDPPAGALDRVATASEPR
jgi:hypothetical protein